jgi:ABC-type dipeptide/oligopeptide/nickel transport system permease component
MTTWLAPAVLLTYLAGAAAVVYLIGHYWGALREEDPALDLITTTQPATVALLLTLIVIAWPITIPLAIHDNKKPGDPT